MPKPKAVGKVIVEIRGERVTATLYPTLWHGQYRVEVNGRKARKVPVTTITDAFSELRRWTSLKLKQPRHA